MFMNIKKSWNTYFETYVITDRKGKGKWIEEDLALNIYNNPR